MHTLVVPDRAFERVRAFADRAFAIARVRDRASGSRRVRRCVRATCMRVRARSAQKLRRLHRVPAWLDNLPGWGPAWLGAWLAGGLAGWLGAWLAGSLAAFGGAFGNMRSRSRRVREKARRGCGARSDTHVCAFGPRSDRAFGDRAFVIWHRGARRGNN